MLSSLVLTKHAQRCNLFQHTSPAPSHRNLPPASIKNQPRSHPTFSSPFLPSHRLHRTQSLVNPSPASPSTLPSTFKSINRSPLVKKRKLSSNFQNRNLRSSKPSPQNYVKRHYEKSSIESSVQSLKDTMVSLEAAMDNLDKNGPPVAEFEFDRTGLHPFGLKRKEAMSWADLEAKKGARNELTKHLHAVIETRGPMSLSTFMRYALTHPVHGYYMKSDVFGKEGDFTTSPEISQMFGELLGVWCSAVWESLGRPEKFHLVELGPGRGTLSSDMINATKHMKNFSKATRLHLVEVSPHLRRLQAQKFGLVYPASISEAQVASIPIPIGLDQHVSASQSSNITQSADKSHLYTIDSQNAPIEVDSKRVGASEKLDVKATSQSTNSFEHTGIMEDVTLKSVSGLEISWHSRFEDLPKFPNGEPILVIAQEFFDALPIHQLEMTKNGWRERLVDIDDSPETSDWFRTVLAPSHTPACALIDPKTDIPENLGGVAPVGMGLEKCAEGMAISQIISDRLSENGGAALFIDYGHEIMSGWSVRGIQDHQFVSIYKNVGNVDLSANVDFKALSRSMLSETASRPLTDRLKQLNIYGPVNQGEFLSSLGIYSRMAKLLRQAKEEPEAEALIAAFKRLVDKDQMGATYKVLGIFSSPKLTPEGFWGLYPSTAEDPTGSSL